MLDIQVWSFHSCCPHPPPCLPVCLLFLIKILELQQLALFCVSCLLCGRNTQTCLHKHEHTHTPSGKANESWEASHCVCVFVCTDCPSRYQSITFCFVNVLIFLTNCLAMSQGFNGTNCEINIDDCPSHECQNGGTCMDGVNTYNCQCPPEWTGK